MPCTHNDSKKVQYIYIHPQLVSFRQLHTSNSFFRRLPIRTPFCLVLILFSIGCTEPPTTSREAPPERNTQPSGAVTIGPATGAAMVDQFESDIGHTTIYSLGNDVEMVVELENEPGGSFSSLPVLSTVVARRDTLYSYDQYGNFFEPPLIGVINTSAMLDPSSSDSLLYEGDVQLQLEDVAP